MGTSHFIPDNSQQILFWGSQRGKHRGPKKIAQLAPLITKTVNISKPFNPYER